MRTFAIIYYLLGALAEAGGLALVVSEFRDSRRALREWVDANPNNNADGSWGQHLVLNKVMIGLLGSTSRRVSAVLLIALGIVAATVGNFLSLPL